MFESLLKKLYRKGYTTEEIKGVGMLDNLITANEASKIYGVSAIYIRKLCQRGKLTARNFGGSWVISRSSADAYFAKPRKKGRPGIDK